MSVARVTEIKASSTRSFDDALREGSALKARLEETTRVVEMAAKPGRFPPTVDA